MFALCITDLIRKKLVLARDRVGMKPLFYHQGEHGLVWASEIKAIVKHEFVRAEINWNGVYTNFLFQTTLAPETCFQHIFSLEPGAFMTVDLNDRTFTTEKFWSLPLKVNESITEEEAIKKSTHYYQKVFRNSCMQMYRLPL